MKILALLLLFFSLSFATGFLEEIEEGVSFYKQKQYERALEIFDRVLINNPNSKRARLEYARVLFAMGRYEESKKEFLIVLNQNPPSIVKKNIKWFIKRIDKKIKKDFFKGSISVGIVRDDNIENKSDNPVYAGFIDSNTKKREDRFITTEFALQYQRRLKDTIWGNTLYFYDESNHNSNKDKISYANFTTTYKFFALGIRVSLPFSLSYTQVDKKVYMQTIALNPSIAKKIKSIVFMGNIGFEKNKNKDNNEKNTKVYSIGVKFLWRLYGFSNIIGVGFKDYKKVNGDRIDVAKRRDSFSLGTSYNILRTNLLNFLYKKSRDKYKEKDPSIVDKRVDKADKYNLNFQQEIKKDLYYQLGFSKISNKSNIDIYSYDKNLVTFKVTKEF